MGFLAILRVAARGILHGERGGGVVKRWLLVPAKPWLFSATISKYLFVRTLTSKTRLDRGFARMDADQKNERRIKDKTDLSKGQGLCCAERWSCLSVAGANRQTGPDRRAYLELLLRPDEISSDIEWNSYWIGILQYSPNAIIRWCYWMRGFEMSGLSGRVVSFR